MDFEKLRDLSEQNDVMIGSHEGHHRTPPYYYDSLRHALGFYFNTFNTQNASYNFYAEGLSRNPRIAKSRDFLDEDNTVLAIVAFERFFELFIKSVLTATDPKLGYSRKARRHIEIKDLVEEIHSSSFAPKSINGKPFSLPFRETLRRFYGLIDLLNNGYENPIVSAFSEVVSKYQFFDSRDYKATLELLNWYRDRILHNGNQLPSLWMLDYLVTQRILPIIVSITRADKGILGNSVFYFKTLTHINIIEKLNDIRYELSQLYDSDKQRDTYWMLLYMGHLKELGRANLNMNLFMRKNIQATYEYNYRDPKGRGRRFAQAELSGCMIAKRVASCPCCGEMSLIVYREIVDDIFNVGSKKSIEWVKCYTCDYHIRDNVGDPSIFSLCQDRLFME